MSNYIGVKCPVCNKKFTSSDDIVVCPICGAPHHRHCYAQESDCHFAADHINGKEWRPPAPEQPSGAEQPSGPESQQADAGNGNTLQCKACGSANPPGVIFCQICGRRMSDFENPAPPAQDSWGFPGFSLQGSPEVLMYGGLSPDEKIEDETARDLAIYIGENSGYYLQKFKFMADTSRSLTFNFSALLFNFFYFFYRKMYVAGVAMLLFSAVVAIPSVMQAWELMPTILTRFYPSVNSSVDQAAVAHYQSMVDVARIISFFVNLIISFCANHFYYVKTLKDMKKINESKSDLKDQAEYASALATKGGTSKIAVICLISGIFALYFVAAMLMLYLYGGGLA